MKGKAVFFKIFITLTVLFLLLLLPVIAFAQSIESAEEKFNSGDYKSAVEEINEILKQNSNNIDAIKLLHKIETEQKKEKSKILTEKALIEIDNRNFKTAYKYLKDAILLDPENQQASDWYLSISEIIQVEEKSSKEQALVAVKKASASKNANVRQGVEESQGSQENQKQIEPQNGVQNIPGASAAVIKPEQKTAVMVPAQGKKIINKERENIAYISLYPTYTFADSNNLDYIDSHITLLGSRLETAYYLPVLNRGIGISIDYSSLFFKATGSNYINFMVHNLNASLRFRLRLFKDYFNNSLIIGIKANYRFFYLYNLESAGVYNFVNLYGPSAGVFISDPIVSRIFRLNFFKGLGFEGEFDFFYISVNAPYSIEYYAGIYYKLKRLKISAGFRSNIIIRNTTLESYNTIQAGVGYLF
ncbi:MAG: hypothetical protein GXP33_04490 [Spirochaetes bacterium]|nr:hypothetical protein [Spirochaetota bacterium]